MVLPQSKAGKTKGEPKAFNLLNQRTAARNKIHATSLQLLPEKNAIQIKEIKSSKSKKKRVGPAEHKRLNIVKEKISKFLSLQSSKKSRRYDPKLMVSHAV